jgi:hypothetical protein
MRSADAREQLAVNLGNEAKRERQVAQPREAVVHRVDIADHLVDVLRQVAPRRPRLELDCEQVFERALRALDLRAEDGLSPNVHMDEEVRIRNRLDDAIETTYRLIGSREERVQRTVEDDRRVRR